MPVGDLDALKTASDVASNVVTMALAIVAAIAAYWAFFRERTLWPKANLELILSHRRLDADETLLHAKVKVHNAGRGLMKLTRIRIDVQQVRPLLPDARSALSQGTLVVDGTSRADWGELKNGRGRLRWGEASDEPDPEPEPELEPGENDEFGCDFVVPASLETVFVYVYVANAAKRRRALGWTVTNYYDLAGESGAESAVNVVRGKAAVAIKEDAHE